MSALRYLLLKTAAVCKTNIFFFYPNNVSGMVWRTNSTNYANKWCLWGLAHVIGNSYKAIIDELLGALPVCMPWLCVASLCNELCILAVSDRRAWFPLRAECNNSTVQQSFASVCPICLPDGCVESACHITGWLVTAAKASLIMVSHMHLYFSV